MDRRRLSRYSRSSAARRGRRPTNHTRHRLNSFRLPTQPRRSGNDVAAPAGRPAPKRARAGHSSGIPNPAIPAKMEPPPRSASTYSVSHTPDCRKRIRRLSKEITSLVSHSHIVSTVHPNFSSAAIDRTSLSRFIEILSLQYSRRVLGSEARGQSS